MNLNQIKPNLSIFTVKTKIYDREQNLIEFLIQNLPSPLMHEEVIIAITSKIVSLAENRLVKRKTREGTPEAYQEKRALIEKEADQFLAETVHKVSLTVKHGILIPSAGIDESNSKGSDYILFPEKPYQSAETIYHALKSHFQLKKMGIIITDSHTTPLRKGVNGIGLSHFGFKATRNLVGTPDLFGREIKMTHVNVLDALSSAAVFLMGESNDSCPIAVIEASGIEFQDAGSLQEIQIPLDEDLYGSFFK